MKPVIIITVIALWVAVAFAVILIFNPFGEESNVLPDVFNQSDCAKYWNNHQSFPTEQSQSTENDRRAQKYWLAEFLLNDCANRLDSWKNKVPDQQIFNTDSWIMMKNNSWNINHWQDEKDPEHKKFYQTLYDGYWNIRKEMQDQGFQS